jgi:thiol-disulfide isomerase/thioredoxin
MSHYLRMLGRAFDLPTVVGIWLSSAALFADVVDEQGQPVAEFWAMANTAEEGYTVWEKCAHGQLPTFEGLQGMKAIDVFVRADGYAPNYVHLTEDLEPLRSLPAKITLRRGTPIELRLVLPVGMTWPDNYRPEVYFVALAERNNIMRQSSNRSRYVEGAPELDFGMHPKPLGDGKFELRLAEDTPPFFVGVHKPGFLRFFDAGPFTLADVKDGVLEVMIPKPAVLHYSFRAPGDAESLPYNAVQFMLLRKLSRLGSSYLMVDSQSKEARGLDVTIGDLAPGEYRVGIHTTAKAGDEIAANDKPNPGVYYDTRTAKLEAGKTNEFEVVYSPPNPDSYRGDGTATICVRATDGSPAAGRPVTVAYLDSHYGATPIHIGAVPDNGEITLTHLTNRSPPGWPYGAYQVKSGDKLLGCFGFQPGEKATRAEFQLPPDVGDLAPDVKFSNLTNGSSASVSDFHGKVVWLEFWATWCGPCQKPIKDLAELAAEHRPEWKDKVALVPVSIDDDPSAVAEHFAERGWNGLTLYWTGVEGDPSQSSSQAPTARAFGVDGVPTAFLIGRDGRILWFGHPLANADGTSAEQRIEAALE